MCYISHAWQGYNRQQVQLLYHYLILIWLNTFWIVRDPNMLIAKRTSVLTTIVVAVSIIQDYNL